jgi:GDP-L-fucose synthase
MFYQGKKVLVTGGTGFVGTHLVIELLNQGAFVRIPVHHRSFFRKDPRIEIVRADLTQPQECLSVMAGMDCVFHAAGAVGAAGLTPMNQLDGITLNLLLAARVLQAAWDTDVKRLLLFSSSTVYPAFSRPVKEEEIWDGPPHPMYHGYGWMKRYLEKLAEFVALHSTLRIAIVRPTAVYGRWDNFDPRTSHVIPALILRALRKENPFVVWGTGEEVRDFLHVTDLARGSLLALEKYAVCDPINVGYGAIVTIRQIVETILKTAGHDQAEVVFDATKPTTIPYRAVDTSLARKAIGFEPAVSLAEGLKDTVEWYTQAGPEKERQKG